MPNESNGSEKMVVIGGGPAGLTAAYQLARRGCRPIVLEKHSIVGGLARTENYKGYSFDMGGHRFFSKSEEVNRMWRDVLGPEFMLRPRLSRIYYQNKFYHYPLKPLNALKNLGVLEGIRILLSYLRWQIRPHRCEDTFEQWVTNRFGKRLFTTFFQAYTEKVWGMSCTELKAEWAAQRIKDMSLRTVLMNMFLKPRRAIKSLIEQFHYPRLGPGMMWNAVRQRIEEHGGTVRLNCDVVCVHRTHDRIDAVEVVCDGRRETIRGADFISSMPVTEFVKKLQPPKPEVRRAAENLRYRDFLVVCLIVDRPQLFEDNWIYVHDPNVHVGRIQNFKNWSASMVADQAKTSLGLEYFCTEGDALWNMSDADLIELAKQELERIGLAESAEVQDGCVYRVPKSYPIYDASYREALSAIRGFVDGLENFQTIGRNGLHTYNNQDHAMLTGMLAVRNLLNGETHDLWSVNADQQYHEEIELESAGTKQGSGQTAVRPRIVSVGERSSLGPFGSARRPWQWNRPAAENTPETANESAATDRRKLASTHADD